MTCNEYVQDHDETNVICTNSLGRVLSIWISILFFALLLNREQSSSKKLEIISDGAASYRFDLEKSSSSPVSSNDPSKRRRAKSQPLTPQLSGTDCSSCFRGRTNDRGSSRKQAAGEFDAETHSPEYSAWEPSDPELPFSSDQHSNPSCAMTILLLSLVLA